MEGSKEQVELLMMYEEVKKQRDQYKRERDTLIKDVGKLREELRMHVQCNDELDRVNKLKDKTISELANYRTNYNYLTNYIKEKAENNPGNSRYIDLVDVIEVVEAD
ncbi:hypothetical protein DD607_26210 [Salmonella sp. 3DZ2-4SM]|nr:hypothetical protein DD607_26210 [Salmonella sp. 3DZ2-4SM]